MSELKEKYKKLSSAQFVKGFPIQDNVNNCIGKNYDFRPLVYMHGTFMCTSVWVLFSLSNVDTLPSNRIHMTYFLTEYM